MKTAHVDFSRIAALLLISVSRLSDKSEYVLNDMYWDDFIAFQHDADFAYNEFNSHEICGFKIQTFKVENAGELVFKFTDTHSGDYMLFGVDAQPKIF